MSSYSPAEIEAKWQEAWAEAETFKAVATADRPKYYVLENVSLPIGPHSHGPCTQLHHGRCDCAL